tara:strand:+ start:2076 stop:3740 length:1665 start_codon:yes stop_codon:yes gene_type:complete
MVDTNVVNFTLPNMRVNPFNIKPLNQNERNLLVGRKDTISKVISWCKHRSSRMVLLVGNRGTGRTSLLNLLGNEAFRHFQFNIFPTNEPMRRLLEELYITVVSDFEVPRLTPQLQENLTKALPKTGRLPILSFDYPNIHGSEIADVFKQITQIIRSLDAVSIIALTPAQLATWPQELIDEFDEEIEIKSFTNKEIFEMIKKRVSSSTRNNWIPPQELINQIEERTGGHPSESIKLMRKIVHSIKSNQNYDDEIIEIFENIKSSDIANHEDDSIEEYITKNQTFEDEFESQSLEPQVPQRQQIEFQEYEEPDIYSEITVNTDLEDDGYEDNYLEVEKNTVINSNKINVNQKAQLPSGGFGRLSGRTRNTNELMREEGYVIFPSDNITANKIDKTRTLDSPVIEREDVTLWIDENSLGNNFLNEMPNIKNDQSKDGLINIQKEKLSSSQFEISLKEMQKPTQIPKNERMFDLNVDKLRLLDDNEIKIIKMCSKREISPSDIEMREILGGIGRTRLSQIFNGLNKNGILSVKKVGRSRMFYLSNNAKSQLKAWGLIK